MLSKFFRDFGRLVGRPRYRRLRRVSALALGAVALSGCLAGGVWNYELLKPDGHGLYAYAVSRGDVRVVVVGNPFAVGKAELDSAVVGALDGIPPGGPRGTYSTNPRPGSKTAIRFVVAFDPAPTVSGYELCRQDEQAQTGPAQGRLGVLIAFCDGGTLQSQASGQFNRPTSPQDPALRSAIANAVWSLIPSPDPTIDGDCAPTC